MEGHFYLPKVCYKQVFQHARICACWMSYKKELPL